MKNARLLSLALSLLAASLSAQATTAAPLKIGTWNLEFLGAPGDFRNKLPLRDDADFQKIGEKVRALGVSVLAVQEICGEAPLQKVAAGAGPSWRVLLGTTGAWDNSPVSQNIGFLYDSARLDLLFAEELLSLPREAEGTPIFHRIPVTAGFRDRITGFDFRLVTVHLKAGQKAPDLKKRELEATLLKGWLDTLLANAREDQDIAVLGDFNSTYGDAPQTILEKDHKLHYLAPKQPTPTIMHFPEPIDQVVPANGFGELRGDSFAVGGGFDGMKPEDWRKIYSDHFPVSVTVDARADEDPDATFARGDAKFALPKTAQPGAPSSAATATADWPFVAGRKVQVTTANLTLVGTLVRNVNGDGTGWIVLDDFGKQIYIHCAQVQKMVAQ